MQPGGEVHFRPGYQAARQALSEYRGSSGTVTVIASRLPSRRAGAASPCCRAVSATKPLNGHCQNGGCAVFAGVSSLSNQATKQALSDDRSGHITQQ